MPSLLFTLRHLMPPRPLTYAESLRVAELQATRLLKLAEIEGPPVPESLIAELPRIQIERLSPIPVSGSAHWAKGRWQIVLNGAEPLVRQRFSLIHEFKHVLDNPFISILYPGYGDVTKEDRAEQVADYFAGCVLIPRVWLKRDWGNRIQQLPVLARRYGVSQVAMRVRLMQTGLLENPARCPGPRYRRLLPIAA